MLIALLAVLGVDLIVVVGLLVFVLSRKRWVMRRPGAFRCAIRAGSGEVQGLGPKWRRGYGRWVRDVFVWTRAPFLFRNELVVIDDIDEQRPAHAGEIKRLGDDAVVARFKAEDATVEVAAHHVDGGRLGGPYSRPALPARPGARP